MICIPKIDKHPATTIPAEDKYEYQNSLLNVFTLTGDTDFASARTGK
jgi:hypothetical protein